MTSDSDDRRASREATDWLIALREEPEDAALRARFDAWIDASPVNAAAWAETHHVDDLIGRARPAGPAREERKVVPVDFARTRARRIAILATASAMAACLMLVFAPGVLLWLQAAHMTSTAEIRTLHLDDGSIVRLGPASAIDVAFAPTERRVRLLKGEAFFEVVGDTSRPFTVESDGVRTTVLGTSFEVRLADDGATDVAVRDGVVRVARDKAVPPVSEQLLAGDRVRIGRAGQVTRSSGPPDETAAWLHGQIVARDRSVADLVDELRRYHRGTIVIADGGLARERVTGVYNLSDPAIALRAVASAHGATVRQISPWLVVISRN